MSIGLHLHPWSPRALCCVHKGWCRLTRLQFLFLPQIRNDPKHRGRRTVGGIQIGNTNFKELQLQKVTVLSSSADPYVYSTTGEWQGVFREEEGLKIGMVWLLAEKPSQRMHQQRRLGPRCNVLKTHGWNSVLSYKYQAEAEVPPDRMLHDTIDAACFVLQWACAPWVREEGMPADTKVEYLNRDLVGDVLGGNSFRKRTGKWIVWFMWNSENALRWIADVVIAKICLYAILYKEGLPLDTPVHLPIWPS